MNEASKREGRVANHGLEAAAVVVTLNAVLVGVGGLYATTGSLVVVIVAAVLSAALVGCLAWSRRSAGRPR